MDHLKTDLTMKTNKLYLTVILLFFIGLVHTFGQDQRTLNTKVADILTEMPSNNNDRMNVLMKTMEDVSVEGWTIMLDQLANNAASDGNQAVRYALTSFARYIGATNNSTVLNKFNTLIIAYCTKSKNLDFQRFLLIPLRYTINNAQIPSLSPLLNNSNLTPEVLMLIESNKSEEAKTFLEANFFNIPAPFKPQLIKSLTHLSSHKLTSDIIELLQKTPLSGNVSLHQAGNEHLSFSTTQASLNYLKTQAAAIGYSPEKDEAFVVQSLVNFSRNTANQGKKELSVAGINAILENCTAENQLKYRYEALSIKMESKVPDNLEKLVSKELKNSALGYVQQVIALSGKNNINISSKVLLKLYKSSETEVQTTIIQYVVAQKNSKLLNDLIESSSSLPNAPLSYLTNGLVAVEGDKSIEKLLSLAHNEQWLEPSLKSLQLIVSNKNASALWDNISSPSAPSSSIPGILNLLAEKSGNSSFDQFIKYTQHADESVRKAAVDNLAKIAQPENLSQITGLVKKLGSDYRESLASALSVALNQIKDSKKQNEALKEVLKQTNDLELIFNLAPTLGGTENFKMIQSYEKFNDYSNQVKQCYISWPDEAAITSLFTLYKANKEDAIFNSLVNIINNNPIPDTQKLLYLRSLMELSINDQQKNTLIRSLGRIRTYPAFKYVSSFINYAAYEQTTARALMNMALPTPQDDHGLYGTDVRNMLNLVIETLAGGEVQYSIADINAYLESMNESAGFTTMFNGKDLSGWKGYVDNPIALKKLNAKELKAKQNQADKDLNKNWSVKDGQIMFEGDGQNLLSVKEYGDFEMYVDWKITKGGDSGIYLRGTPQVQIWDTSRVEVGAQVGSGGLYNNQKNQSKPSHVADNPVGEWNSFHIIMIGEKVTVELNGQTVVDQVPLENYWDRNQAIFPTGTIELQAHGSQLAFRDIYVREISSPDFGLTNEEKRDGFKSLFNGANLEGWTGNKVDYSAENGTIIISPKSGDHGNLYTEKEYSNFVFRFEFQLTPGANNGLGIHAPLEGDAAYVGKELQILDNTADIYSDLHEWQYHGSIYGVVAAKRGFLKPVGEWNAEEVRVNGNRITIILNGETIVDADYVKASAAGTLDGNEHPGIKRKTGHIGFLGHGSVVKFRNIRIKEL